MITLSFFCAGPADSIDWADRDPPRRSPNPSGPWALQRLPHCPLH